jgi:F-type H+-transporting ATPase subunit b
MSTANILGVVVGLVLIVGMIGFGNTPILQQSPIPGIDFSLQRTLINLGLILLLLPVIEALYIKPLKAAIDDRNRELERTFADAEDLRTKMTELRRDYESRLAATEASAREQIQAQIKDAQALRQTLAAEATAKADALLEAAHAQIEQDKNRALLEIRSVVVDLTLTATEKLLGETMDTARNRKLVEDFITGVEVAH